MAIDSYRFLDFASRQVMKAWAARQEPGVDPRFGEADLDVVLPMRRLTELAALGVVGRAAATHYSMMGYILEPKDLSSRRAVFRRWRSR
jgi:hypothetical protein